MGAAEGSDVSVGEGFRVESGAAAGLPQSCLSVLISLAHDGKSVSLGSREQMAVYFVHSLPAGHTPLQQLRMAGLW